jgi:hypothetical protein
LIIPVTELFLAFTSSNDGTDASKVTVPVFVKYLLWAKLKRVIENKIKKSLLLIYF